MIRSAYYIIKNFADVDNNFRQIFSELHGRFKDYLFLNEMDLCVQYKIKDGCSYKKAIKIVDKYCRDAITKRDEKIERIEGELFCIEERYKDELKDRAVEIFGLKEDVEKYKRMANI